MIYTIGKLLPAAAGFLLLPIYSQYLTPQEYAIIASMEVLTSIFGIFVSLNLERAAYRFYFDKEDDQWRRDLLFTLHYSAIGMSLFWLMVCWVLQNVISLMFPDIPFWPIYMLVIGRTCIEVMLRVPQQYLQVTERPLAYVAVSLSRFALSVVLVLLFLILYEQGAQGSLTGNLLSSVVLAPVGMYIAVRHFSGRFRLQVLKDAIAFCWPFIPTLLVAWIIDLSDRIFMGHYASAADLGIYGMAYKIASVYLLVMGAYHAAYLPHFYKLAGDTDQLKAKHHIQNEANNNVLLHLAMLLLAVMWSYEVVTWFLDEEYAEVTHILRLILFSHLFACIPAVTSSAALMQAKKTRLNMYAALAAAVINLLLNFILIPKYSLYGAATATLLSMVSLFVIQYLASRLAYFITMPWALMLTGLSGTIFVLFVCYKLEQHLLLGLAFKSSISLLLVFFVWKYMVKRPKSMVHGRA